MKAIIYFYPLHGKQNEEVRPKGAIIVNMIDAVNGEFSFPSWLPKPSHAYSIRTVEL